MWGAIGTGVHRCCLYDGTPADPAPESDPIPGVGEPVHGMWQAGAVIARKVSQCSKNTPGAQAFAAFTSMVWRLATRGVHSMVEGLYEIFRAASV